MVSGTIVVWERLDGAFAGANRSIDALFEIAESVSRHIGMTFHRFISNGKVEITINGATVRAWNPFMADHPECVVSGPQTLRDNDRGHEVGVTGYVLPSKSRLSDDDYESGGGPLGWLEQQGFYIYRQDRVVVAGGWLGIGRAGKAWRLDRKFVQARINLDITNSADLDWGLDVRKSMASPPAAFLKPLRQLAEEIRRRSKNSDKAFRTTQHAVRDSIAGTEIPIWIVAPQASPVPQFRINRRHPVVRDLRNSVKDQKKLRALLLLIDREAPVQPRTSGAISSAVVVDASRALQDEAIRQLAATVYYSHRNARRLSMTEALEAMLASPAFKEHEALVTLTIEEIERGKKG
jgi:hypothetical protein